MGVCWEQVWSISVWSRLGEDGRRKGKFSINWKSKKDLSPSKMVMDIFCELWAHETYPNFRTTLRHYFKFGFMHNVVRDLKKKSQYENWPFSRQSFHQIQLDMANKKCVLTSGMDKWKKCTSQIFNFWKGSRCLRNFQKARNYGNWPFSRPFFHQIQLDMAQNNVCWL